MPNRDVMYHISNITGEQKHVIIIRPENSTWTDYETGVLTAQNGRVFNVATIDVDQTILDDLDNNNYEVDTIVNPTELQLIT